MFLFTDAFNTFYLRLYGVGHMVKDHSDSERGNPLPPHRLLFPIGNKDYFICTRQDSIYHVIWYTSRGALAGTRNSSMGPPWRIDPTTHRTMSERFYHGATYRSLYNGATYRSLYNGATSRSLYNGATSRSLYNGATYRSLYNGATSRSLYNGATYRSLYNGATSRCLL